jgi:hypothetical protein
VRIGKYHTGEPLRAELFKKYQLISKLERCGTRAPAPFLAQPYTAEHGDDPNRTSNLVLHRLAEADPGAFSRLMPLRRAGRGVITIRNSTKLHTYACECFDVIARVSNGNGAAPRDDQRK